MKLKEEAEKQYQNRDVDVDVDAANRKASTLNSNASNEKSRDEEGGDEANASSTWGKISFLNQNDIATLSNDQLKRHLAARNESTDGSKKKLIERLSKSIEEEKQREIRLALEKEHCRTRDLEQKGSVYVTGKNDQGQLGLDDLDDRHVFTVIPALRGKEVCHVSAYGTVCIAATPTSEVYVWGGNGVNPIAIGHAESFSSPQQMTKLIGEETVVTSAGSTHACSISQAGDLFVWGKLGSDDTRLTPQYVDKFTAASVACGAKHISVITDKGELFAWGGTSSGRLGVGSVEQAFQFQATPKLVKLPEPVRLIACGSTHTIAATESRRVFSWGCGDGYRLGHGENCSERTSPCEITTITALGGSQILDISAGVWHSACVISNESSSSVDTSGFLYTWGSGYCGQLALGKQCIATTPTKVNELNEVKRIFCGRTHNVAITHDNALYTWGSNEHGQLGRSIEEPDVTFTPRPGIVELFGTIVNRIGRGAPKSVACGHDFTVVATHPYEGPTEQEMIKLLETKHLKEQEEKKEQARLLQVQEDEAARQREAEAEKIKILYLTSKRLCTVDPTCPGFTYEPSKPSICRECGYSVAFHTIVTDEHKRRETDGGAKE